MKFEFVEFYRFGEKSTFAKKYKGTVHIYCIDCELDIRGILVSVKGKSVFFVCPHFFGVDEETGEKISYPLLRWTNEKTHSEMMDFLHGVVKPKILAILKEKKDDKQQVVQPGKSSGRPAKKT